MKRQRAKVAIGALLLTGLLCGWVFDDHVRAAYGFLRLESHYGEFDLEAVPHGAHVVAVVAHPDDECFLFAGTLLRLMRERDARVTLVSFPSSRDDELMESSAILGVHATRLVPFDEDVGTAPVRELDAALTPLLDELDPDVIMGFGPEGITGHPDHQASGLAVWRWAHRRGRGILMRAVMPSEFSPLVGKYAAAPEPGWGVGPVLLVPLGDAGELRSRSADAYVSQRHVLARDEWLANFVNTEFWEVTEFDGATNSPRLHDSSAEPVVHADEVLLLVHPTHLWDLHSRAKPGVDSLVERFDLDGKPIFSFVNATYPFTYLERRGVDRAFVSRGGEHELRLDAQTLWVAGGSYGSCLERGLQCAVAKAIDQGRRELEVVLPTDAIYSIVFQDPQVGAWTLQERMQRSEDHGRELITAIAQRWIDDALNGTSELGIPTLTRRLQGWTISIALGEEEPVEWRVGDGSGSLLLRAL